ncbi:GpE family phage tail protein [Escherichia coli]|nr:GpE family phage tail protein [Escherichia coli]EIP0481142.1 GpE family phage tail protein [Escherichia coli]ELW5346210.1 GpE family phage tail protein [Escherichia coli]NUE30431.1 GpE family phage tail protein [Escherichia coli]HEI1634812.1 GpE family phage tail protein [Escherichia coli]
MRSWSRSNRLQPPRTASSTVTEVLEWRYKAIQRSGANDE